MSPAGIGCSRPLETTDAELVAGATRSSPIPSRSHSSAALGFRVKKLSGPKSTGRPRNSPGEDLAPETIPGLQHDDLDVPRRRAGPSTAGGRRSGEDAGRTEPAYPTADDGDDAPHVPRASPPRRR